MAHSKTQMLRDITHHILPLVVEVSISNPQPKWTLAQFFTVSHDGNHGQNLPSCMIVQTVI